MAVTPMTEPTSDAAKIMNGTERQPRKAPIIASSLMSPPPIPSLPVSFS